MGIILLWNVAHLHGEENALDSTSKVNLQLLTTHIAVYETRQFTAAAAELHVSQSTISKRIAALEDTLGVALFVRHTASDVVPTRAGHEVYETASSICGLWSNLVLETSRDSLQPTPFTLLLSHTASSTLLPKIIQHIQPGLSALDFSAKTMNSDNIADAIVNKQAQMGIVEKPVETDSARLSTLCEDHLVLAGKRDGRQGRDSVWLVREAGSGVRYYTDLFFRTSNIRPSTIIELDSNEKICAVLSRGIGCSVISRASAPAGIPIVELGGEFTRHYFAMTPKTGLSLRQSSLARNITELLQGRDSTMGGKS